MNSPAGTAVVLVVGEINPDVVVTGVPVLTFGQREDLAGPTTMTVGSSAAITACALTRLGTPTALVGVVGDDAFAAFMLKQLNERGVDTRRVRCIPGGRTGSSVILVRQADSGDRHILTDAGVMDQLRAEHVDVTDTAGLRHLHIASWFLQTGAVAEFPALLAEAHRRGLGTSVDPNDDPGRGWDAHLSRALPHVDTFFCNESEARGVAGALGWPSDGTAQDAARYILRRLHPDGIVVLKCGAHGAYAQRANTVVHVPAPSVHVLDTVGAGDTLAAAFLHSRLRGEDVQSSLRLAVAAGSLSTRRRGGVDGQPTSDEASGYARSISAATPNGSDPQPLRHDHCHQGSGDVSAPRRQA